MQEFLMICFGFYPTLWCYSRKGQH